MKKILFIICMAVGLIGLTACNKLETKITKDITAMDTYMTITCYGRDAKKACDAAITEIKRLDELFSVGNPDSEVNKISNGYDGELSEDSLNLLDIASKVKTSTDGAFDIAIRPLVELWGFEKGELYVPTKVEVEKALDECKQGTKVDFGGIAKGYTSSKLMRLFESYDIRYAIVSLGGNIQCYGKKTDGSDFNIAITDPNSNNGDVLGSVKIDAKAVITSGGYERNFVDKTTGKKYCHILSPYNGYPVESDISSVTIISDDGTLADALSTACYVMGLEKTIEYWKKHRDEYDFVILSGDEIYATKGIAGKLSTEYRVNIVE